MNQTLYRFLARRYVLFRGRISPPRMKEKTIQVLNLFSEKLAGLTDEQFAAHPASGKWGAMEISFHAINAAKGMLKMADGLGQGQKMPDVDNRAVGKTKSVSREECLQLCRSVLQQATELNYNGSRTGRSSHPIIGSLNQQGWLAMNLVHLERHYKQMERALQNL